MEWRKVLLVSIFLPLAASIKVGAAQQIDAGSALKAALQLEPGNWFIAAGGLPQPLTDSTRLQPGAQQVLLLRQATGGALESVRWLDLNVAGDEGTGDDGVAPPAAAALVLDEAPPLAQFSIVRAIADAQDRLLAAPGARVRVTWSDPSGVADWNITDSHPGSSAPGLWLAGSHRLTATASDALGNRGIAGALEFVVDDSGPEVDWALDSTALTTAAGELVYTPPVQLRVSASDPAGVVRVVVNDGESEQTATSGQSLSLMTDAVEIVAVDGLGNRRQVRAAWQYDQTGPSIELAPLAEGSARGQRIALPVGGTLSVMLADAGVGVAEARYRYNHKAWQPIPERIRFVHRGRYKVEVEATDKLGNQTVRIFDVRTKGRSSARPGAQP